MLNPNRMVMKKNDVMNFIDIALKDLDIVIEKSSFLTNEHSQVIRTKNILNLLNERFKSSPICLETRMIRGVHDLGMFSYKYFENTPLEESLENICCFFYENIEGYKNLKPLGLDFGRGNPI